MTAIDDALAREHQINDYWETVVKPELNGHNVTEEQEILFKAMADFTLLAAKENRPTPGQIWKELPPLVRTAILPLPPGLLGSVAAITQFLGPN